jgi:hypothetical protein
MRSIQAIMVLVLSACATRPRLEPGAEKILTTIPQLGPCYELKQIEATGSSMWDVEVVARNKAHKLGATHIILEVPQGAYNEGISSKARALKCPLFSRDSTNAPGLKSRKVFLDFLIE